MSQKTHRVHTHTGYLSGLQPLTADRAQWDACLAWFSRQTDGWQQLWLFRNFAVKTFVLILVCVRVCVWMIQRQDNRERRGHWVHLAWNWSTFHFGFPAVIKFSVCFVLRPFLKVLLAFGNEVGKRLYCELCQPNSASRSQYVGSFDSLVDAFCWSRSN